MSHASATEQEPTIRQRWGVPRCGYFANAAMPHWIVGPIGFVLIALAVGYFSLTRCDASLRRWYNRNHGVKVVD